MSRPFVPPGTASHYTPDRPVGVSHVKLEMDLDLGRKRLKGTSTLSLQVRRDDIKHVMLHAVEMHIEDVGIDGKSGVPFDYDGQHLRIALPAARKRDERLEIAIRYTCSPRRGLYFCGPDKWNPERPLQAWTQGQDEDSRHYWPCVDAPIEKSTSEMIATAPMGNFVLSNGELRERRELPDGRVRWHYVLDFPHPSYLVTLVCGPFAEIKERTKKTGVDVYTYVPPGRERDGKLSFGRTGEMIDFFSERIGITYPHKRYSQIAVTDFIFGGMENTSATTLTDLSLLDDRAALDHDVEALVSHELAHQWWGDLLTCRDWSEAWLNEGFATYFEYVWREHAKGRDEADVELLADSESYLSEAGSYQRPIVCREYEEPIDLFDRHLYEKGGRVLHMLRHDLGDGTFWRAIKLYAERHSKGSVETRDLARDVEDVSGRNLDRFFDQWVGRSGHPDIEVSWSWDDDRGVGTLKLEQKQPADRTFSFRTLVRFEVGGAERDEAITVTERTHSFEFQLAQKPTQVVFDPGDVVLKTIKMEKARPLWQRQLKAARLGVDRILAARGLSKLPEPDSVSALREALSGDAFWGVRAAAARALGAIRREDAVDALVAGLADKHPKVRRAAVWALGEMRGDDKAAEALAAKLGKGDPSYFVEAETALALGRVRSPRAVDLLPTLFGKAAFQDVIRSRALDGLGATGDERAIPIVRAEYRPGVHFLGRRAAVGALAKLAEGTLHARAAREFLEACLDDPDFRVRSEAADGLALIADGRATTALERALERELDGRTRRHIKDALTSLREGTKPAEQLRKAQDELERLRAETAKLRERLEKLEAKNGTNGASGGNGLGLKGRLKKAVKAARRGRARA